MGRHNPEMQRHHRAKVRRQKAKEQARRKAAVKKL
jgi:hypothetical protein